MIETIQTSTDSAVGEPSLLCDFPFLEISNLAEQESWRKEIHRPLYHIHKWWATRLGSVFRALTLGTLLHDGQDIWDEFYNFQDFSKRVILDPFMGSGTTIGEALKLGCKAIGCDINPISTFLVREALTYVNEQDLVRAFKDLEERVAPDILQYYTAQDPVTGEPLRVLYYFWVKVVTVPSGNEIPLFNSYIFSKNAIPKKNPAAQIVCPFCWGLNKDRYDASQVTCAACGKSFDPRKGPAAGQYVHDGLNKYKIKELIGTSGPPKHKMYALLTIDAAGNKRYLPATAANLSLYQEAEERLKREKLPLPNLALRPGHNTNQAIGYNYREWKDFFNPRQLLCLGLLLKAIMEIADTKIRDQLLILFSGTLEFNNLFCSFKGEGTGAVRHMFSHHILKPERMPLENSVWGFPESSGTFSTMFRTRLLRAKKYLDEPFELYCSTDLFGNPIRAGRKLSSKPLRPSLSGSFEELMATPQATLVLNGNSASLPIPAGVIDAVVTDPPYFDFVHYSELSDFFFAWLTGPLSRSYSYFAKPDSSSSAEVQNKNPDVFTTHLSAVFRECHRVLKNDGLLVFSFHHSRPEGWAAIHAALSQSDFQVLRAWPVHAELRASSPKSASREPISLDAVLVCAKITAPFMRKAMVPDKLLEKFSASSYKLSKGDAFVIHASQVLIELGPQAQKQDVISALAQVHSRYSGHSR